MIRTVIVDDEILGIKKLEHLFSKYDNFEIIGRFLSATEAIDFVSRVGCDLIISDIMMPEINGIEFTKKIREISKDILLVYVTAYDEYTLDAFELGAFDYMLKPVSNERFAKMIDRVIYYYDGILGIDVYNKNQQISNELCKDCSKVYIRTFGNFEIYDSSGVFKNIKWRSKKVKELFLYLILNKDKRVHKDVIIEALWGNSNVSNYLSNLNTTVYQLRKQLVDEGITITIDYTGGYYSCSSEGYQVDFDELLTDNFNISNYKGEFLSGEDYNWSTQAASEFRSRFIGILLKKVNTYISSGDYSEAIRIFEENINHDIFNEELWHIYLLSLLSNNEKAKFIIKYNEFKTLLMDEFGIEPNDKIKKLTNMKLV